MCIRDSPSPKISFANTVIIWLVRFSFMLLVNYEQLPETSLVYNWKKKVLLSMARASESKVCGKEWRLSILKAKPMVFGIAHTLVSFGPWEVKWGETGWALTSCTIFWNVIRRCARKNSPPPSQLERKFHEKYLLHMVIGDIGDFRERIGSVVLFFLQGCSVKRFSN